MSISTLPQELLDTIVDHFADSLENLCILSLVHRTFLRQCQRHLFQVVELANGAKGPTNFWDNWILNPEDDQELRHATLIASSLHLPSVILHLTLSCRQSQVHTKEYLSYLITSLRTLCLRDVFFDEFNETEAQLLPSFLERNPLLEKLEISSAVVEDPRQLFPHPTPSGFLSELKSLTVRKITYEPDPENYSDALENSVQKLLSTVSTSVPPIRRPRPQELTVGFLEAPIMDLLFLHPQSVFDLHNTSSDDAGCSCRTCTRHLETLHFLPMGHLPDSHALLLDMFGRSVDDLEMRVGDWQSAPGCPTLSGNIAFPNLTHLTLGCMFPLQDSQFLPWLGQAIRGTRIKQITFRVLQLYRPIRPNAAQGLEDNAAADPQDDVAGEYDDAPYIDSLDGSGHEEEDDGFVVRQLRTVESDVEVSHDEGDMNREFDTELAVFLGETVAGTLESPPLMDKISFVALNGPVNRREDTICDAKQYLPEAAKKAKEVGIQFEMIVLGEDSDIRDRFQ